VNTHPSCAQAPGEATGTVDEDAPCPYLYVQERRDGGVWDRMRLAGGGRCGGGMGAGLVKIETVMAVKEEGLRVPE